MTMLSVRIDDGVANEIDRWCDAHATRRSDFVREALRLELNRRRAIDEAEWIGDDDPECEATESFVEVQAWAPQEDWADWRAWLNHRDATEPKLTDTDDRNGPG